LGGVCWSALAAALVWAYTEPMGQLAFRWWNEPDYLHGMFVPPLALYLLWSRRPSEKPLAGEPSVLGVVLLALAGLMRLAAAFYRFELLDPLSLLPCLAGLVLMLGGKTMLRWTAPALAFLVFMVPLPGFLAGLMSQPLQRLGTIAGTFLLQTLGISAMARGNVILLRSVELGIVEACSGLRMLMLFVAVSSFAALVIRRPIWQRVVVLASSIPIALTANVLRITLTGVLHETARHGLAAAVYHDLAGCIMMPFVVAALTAEVAILDRLFKRAPIDPDRRNALARALVAPPSSPSHGKDRRRRRRLQAPHAEPVAAPHGVPPKLPADEAQQPHRGASHEARSDVPPEAERKASQHGAADAATGGPTSHPAESLAPPHTPNPSTEPARPKK
jgi:exosortase